MVDGQRTDDGNWLYYKLTNEPKGSGELKSQPLEFSQTNNFLKSFNHLSTVKTQKSKYSSVFRDLMSINDPPLHFPNQSMVAISVMKLWS